MAEPESGEAAQRRARKALVVFVVAAVLLLAAIGYLGGSMLGWWATRDWAVIAAAVALAGVIGFGRLWNK